MRTFPAIFAAEVARRNGSAPVWLLRFTAGGVDYVLCQDAVNIVPWAITALPLIASWGKLDEGVTGTLADYRIADLSVNLLDNPDAATSLRSRVKARQLHGIAVSVYLWFDGITDPPQEMYRFCVRDIDLPSEALINLDLQDESIKYENYFPGTIVSRTEFPYADPDDIGKIIPIPFGTVSKLQALALDAGIQTTLTSNISSGSLSFEVGDAIGFVPGTLIMVDDEGMEIVTVSGDIVTVLRGVGGTQAINHQRGATAWEQRDEFIYVIADYPMGSFGKVYSRIGTADLNVTPLATKYTGQPGNEHPAFPGMAVVSMPGYITVSQAVALIANNATLTTVDGTQLYDGLGLLDYLSVSGGLTYGENIRLVDALTMASGGKNWNTGTLAYTSPTHTHAASTTIPTQCTGLPTTTVQSGGLGNNASVSTPNSMATGTTSMEYEVTINVVGAKDITITVPGGGSWYMNTQVGSTWANVNLTAAIQGWSIATGLVMVAVRNWATASGGYIQLVSVKRNDTGAIDTTATSSTIDQSPGTLLGSTGSAADLAINTPAPTGSTRIFRDPATGLTASGYTPRIDQSQNNRIVRDTGTIQKADINAKWTELSGAPAISGNSVANTLIGDAILVDVVSFDTLPPDVISNLLGIVCNQTGQFPAGYAFNGAITTSQQALAWCHVLARQCRAYFRWILGVPTLIVRPDALTPVHAIAEIRLANGEMIHGQRLTDVNDVINTINLQYDRDWSGNNSAAPYKNTITGADGGSITTYGVRERPELFKFDFVTSDTMAADLLAFYLKWQAWQRWQHTQEVYLFDAALEFGDAVTLSFLDGEIGECTEVGFNPGNGTNIDKIQLTVIE